MDFDWKNVDTGDKYTSGQCLVECERVRHEDDSFRLAAGMKIIHSGAFFRLCLSNSKENPFLPILIRTECYFFPSNPILVYVIKRGEWNWERAGVPITPLRHDQTPVLCEKIRPHKTSFNAMQAQPPTRFSACEILVVFNGKRL